MNGLVELLKERIRVNEGYIRAAKKELRYNKVQGELYVCNNRGTLRFYHRSESIPHETHYLNKSKTKLIKQLASKTYHKKVIEIAEAEISWLKRTLTKMPTQTVERIYEDNKGRLELITPVYQSDEEFIKVWEAKEYERKPFASTDPVIMTIKGERVRSKSEKDIADLLYHLGIPYRYEYPITIGGIVFYPDFLILNVRKRKEVIHEHLGMMDSESYLDGFHRKYEHYISNGIIPGDRLSLSFESKKHPLNTVALEAMFVQMFM